MANTIDFILTTAAYELISKALNGKTVNFTRMAIGEGFSYDTTVAKGYTTLVNEVLSIDIIKSETLSPSSVRITSVFKNTDAQKEYEAILVKDSSVADAYYGLGNIYEKLGDTAKARSEWRKTLKVQINHSGAISKLGL